ncbi:MAG: DUF1294 domain-containing protein [Lachnospiraceae bacterium]|nr:DUF1294 domain-containing protein [Lachnospiraceae bacterium]
MILVYYLISINLLAFIIYGVDKRKAIKDKYRIPEKALIAFAVFGGAFGALLGMKLFHHKTKKKKFYITVPFFAVVYLVLIIYILSQTNILQ